MKYAVTWTSSFRHLDEIDEVIFPDWSIKDTLINSFKRNRIKKTQRIILTLDWLDDDKLNEAIIYINKAKAEGYNIAVQIPLDRRMASILKEENIDFMFSKYAAALDEAYTQAMMGASDVYVVQNLAFRIRDLQYIRETFNTAIRLIPNIAQIGGFTKEIDSMQKFWIRPEDTEIYEPYVDVFELYGTSNRLSVVYEIYKDRRWFGDLDDIILDFNSNNIRVPNGSMPPHIGRERLNCGQACFMGRCNLCTQFAETARKMEEVGIEVRKDKYIPPMSEERKEELLKQFEDKLNELRSNEESV